MARSRLMRGINIAFLAIGVAALAWMVQHIGLDAVYAGMRQIGAGFALLCAFHALAIAIDSVTMRACAGDEGQRVPLRTYLRVSLAGHAINEATPLGKLGEVTKFTLLSEHLPSDRAAAALIIQNLLMGIANCALIAGAPLVAIMALHIDGDLTRLLLITSGIFAAVGMLMIALMYHGLGQWPFRILRALRFGEQRVSAWQQRWNNVEALWHEATAQRSRMRVAWLSALVSRMVSVGENALVLAFLGVDNALAVGALSLASFQLIHWLTSIVPMQAGTAEGGAYVLFRGIGVAPHIGVLTELVRKVRRLAFVGVGVALLGWSTFRDLTRGAQPTAKAAREPL